MRIRTLSHAVYKDSRLSSSLVLKERPPMLLNFIMLPDFVIGILLVLGICLTTYAMPMTKIPARKIAFYLRYSSANQRGDSIDDQRRNITEHLERIGISYQNHIEFADEAVSGMSTKHRKDFQVLLQKIKRGEIEMVVVDDLSRLTRAKDLGVLWDTMKAYRCRFISAIDNIDSERAGDEISALIKGLMNNITNEINGRRIRRGIVGRVLDGNGAYGAHPYGYESVYCSPEEAANFRGIGPKPKKELRIKPDEAAIIVEVFQGYTEQNQSLTDIARELNSRKVPLGSRSNRKGQDGVTRYHTGWTKKRVRELLTQRKYIGDWLYGEKKHVKDVDGKRITYDADPDEIICTKRPELRIVQDDVWRKAQIRLQEMKDKYGMREGQRKRGHKRSHCSEDYPFTLSSGLIFCGSCGSRLHYTPGDAGPYYSCPIAHCGGNYKGETSCSQHGFVHITRSEKALTDYMWGYLQRIPEWLDTAYDAAVATYRQNAAECPNRQQLLESESAEIERSLENLTSVIARGERAPDAILKRIREYEKRKETIDAELYDLQQTQNISESLPDKAWVKEQLGELRDVFDHDVRTAALLMRAFFGKVRMVYIVAPGKKRGYPELRFTPNTQSLVNHIMKLDPAEYSTEDDANLQDVMGAEVRLALGGPTKLDRLMPEVDILRAQQVGWKAIGKKLGLSPTSTRVYYLAWKKALACSDSAAGDVRSDSENATL